MTAWEMYQNCKALNKSMALVTAICVDSLMRYTRWYISATLPPAMSVFGIRDVKSDMPNSL